MPKLKVLPLEYCMDTSNYTDMQEFVDSCVNPSELGTYAGRRGYYLLGNDCWFENEFGLVKADAEHFRYTLLLLNAGERPLSDADAARIRGLLRSADKRFRRDKSLAALSLATLYQLDCDVKYRRQMTRGIRLTHLRSNKMESN